MIYKDSEQDIVIPFLKWAGGKRWFCDNYLDLIPDYTGKYIEPFLGGGALFFALCPRSALLSDLNSDLISTYCSIRRAPFKVYEQLLVHHSAHGKEYYYTTRAKKPVDSISRAAWFIYLNRTCWNGLYRVNLKNEFNVPIGTKSNVVMESDNFLALSQALRSAKLTRSDFEDTIDAAEEGDFVFVDPPYTVKHNFNGFLKYNDKIFSWSDQVRLRDAVVRASSRGAKVMVMNANHKSIRDLYDGFGKQTPLQRASVLAANSSFRSEIEELLIRSWLPGRPRAAKKGQGESASSQSTCAK